MYSEYYTLRGLILSEDKILKESDKERLLKYLDENISYNYTGGGDIIHSSKYGSK